MSMVFSRRGILAAALSLWAAATAAQAAEIKPAGKTSGRIAVVYFSKTGNTKSLAEAVSALCGADLFRVETEQPYPAQYREATEVVKDEIEKGIVRALKPVSIDVTRYDTIVLCTPTWWHHVAKPLETWIRGADLSGKFVITANTHGGGGLMHTREDFEKLLTKSRLGTHLTHFGSADVGDSDVRTWLRQNGLLAGK